MKSPRETLRIRRGHGTVSFYKGCSYESGKTETYLSRKDPSFPGLALKYCANRLKKALENQRCVLLKNPEKYDPEYIERLLEDLEAIFGEMMPPAFSSCKTYIRQWETAVYTKNPLVVPGQRLYKTAKGDLVRSKLEMIIADILFQLGIPYRYEAAVTLADGSIRYPDFTILCPSTRKLYYLEVCGMMDDPSYVDSLLNKLHGYSESGIIEGDNLLLVFENHSVGFDPDDFKRMLFVNGILQ